MPVYAYVIYRRDPDGRTWTPVASFHEGFALAAERRVDALKIEQPGVYRMWIYTTSGYRLLRDTSLEE